MPETLAKEIADNSDLIVNGCIIRKCICVGRKCPIEVTIKDKICVWVAH